MQNININDGSIRLTINNDENRIIEFNPNDLAFAERFYGLISDFEAKEKEYKEKSLKLDKNKETDSYGIPKNMGEGLALLKELCEYMKEKIDFVFGEGTSNAAFGTANTIRMFEQFFDGITPFIQQARSEKVSKYTANRAQRRTGKVLK